MSPARQIVILVGGKGSRLGVMGQGTPKPLMPIDTGTVFLDHLLAACLRQSFSQVILLAGHLGDQVQERYAHRSIAGVNIDVVIENEPMGTGGALRHVGDHLAEKFIMLNGDTLFDLNLRALDQALSAQPGALGCMALRRVDDVGRYGAVQLAEDGTINSYLEKSAAGGGGLINGGIYALRRDVIDMIPAGNISIENDVFPKLTDRGLLIGLEGKGYFLDIGLPETLQIARDELPNRKRPVLFLDRDGVINLDHGYVSTIDRWDWVPGAQKLIRVANDCGVAVVVATNQAGVARGYYDEADVYSLHWRVQRELMSRGSFIDAFFHCSDHPDANDGAFRIKAPLGRKPDGTMLARAARQLGLDLRRSLMVGDQISDLVAAASCGVPAIRFLGGNLYDQVTETPEWKYLQL